MYFAIVFLILYGVGFGVCRLTLLYLTGIDATLIKIVSFIPIINVIATIFIIAFAYYIVRDYRKDEEKRKSEKIVKQA